MMKTNAFAIALLLALQLVCSPAEQHPVHRTFLLNRDVLALARAGFNEQVIIETIHAKPNQFDTTAPGLSALAVQGVSEHILQAMRTAKVHGAPADHAIRRPSQPDPPLDANRIQPIRILPEELPMAARGAPYRALIGTQVDGQCPIGNVSLALAGGALPKGLELTMFGLDGTPGEMGRFLFHVRAANGCAAVSRLFELVVTGKPILEAAPDEITFSCPTPAQAPATKTILVSSTWPSLPYTVETRNASWLRVAQQGGVTPDPDSALTGDVVTLTVDPAELKPGTYRGSVFFWTQHGANAPSVPVVLVVGAPK